MSDEKKTVTPVNKPGIISGKVKDFSNYPYNQKTVALWGLWRLYVENHAIVSV